METAAQKLGMNLKRIRTEKGISQGSIARMLKIDKAFISNIENGKTNPTLATIERIAAAINVSVDELLR
ncbi:MAG: helix-turn-helix transcriptional regulator [Candidatus Paceibacterota bacterium]|jgi:transcriptional regulator with XRE-family HTH domain